MARDFNGSTQYLENTATVLGTQPLTIAAWVNPDTLTANHVVAGLFNSAGQAGHYLQVSSTNLVYAVTVLTGSPNSGFNYSTKSGVTTGSWQHVAAVFASAASRTAYYNGVAGTADTVSSDPTTMNRTEIGRYLDNVFGSVNFFDGKIAEVGIWNVALSTDEIVALAAGVSALRIRPDALKFYVPVYGVESPENNYVSSLSMTLVNAPAASNHPALVQSPLAGFGGWPGAFTAAAGGGTATLTGDSLIPAFTSAGAAAVLAQLSQAGGIIPAFTSTAVLAAIAQLSGAQQVANFTSSGVMSNVSNPNPAVTGGHIPIFARRRRGR